MTPMTNQEFRTIWKRTGLTLSQLANRLGITSADTVRAWASGKRPVSGPASVLMRMIDNDDQAAPDRLVANLRNVECGNLRDGCIIAEAIAMIEKGNRWW